MSCGYIVKYGKSHESLDSVDQNAPLGIRLSHADYAMILTRFAMKRC